MPAHEIPSRRAYMTGVVWPRCSKMSQRGYKGLTKFEMTISNSKKIKKIKNLRSSSVYKIL